jgi:hypothetical protein
MGIVLTNSAKFNPYTFDELIKPLAMATQEYNAIEEGIAELGSKADLMRMYANEEPDSEWSKKYNEYANDLDRQAESLAKYGLNPKSRQGLLNLKKAYSSSVSPIEEAVAARKEAYKYRDTIRAKDNTVSFKNQTLSLSDFMNGKVGDNTYISNKDIMARVSAKAQIEGTNLFNSLIAQKYKEEQALQKVNEWYRDINNPIIAEELKAIGFEDYSPEDQAKIMNSISTGMYNAASEIAKGEYMTALQRKTLGLQEATANRAEEQANLTKLRFEADLAKSGLKLSSDGKSVEFDTESPLVVTDPITGKPTLRGKESIVMADGTVLDRSGSKPVLRDKNGNLIQEYKGKKADQILSESQEEARLNALPNIQLDFTSDDFNPPGPSDEFSTSDAEEINVSSLSVSALKKLEVMLAAYNMTINDVTIYKDQDNFSNNHYRIVKKGRDKNNMPIVSNTVIPTIPPNLPPIGNDSTKVAKDSIIVKPFDPNTFL